jgi:hypothetical protein
MEDPSPNYRVIPRRKGIALLLLLVLLIGAAALAIQALSDSWALEFKSRLDQDPSGAAHELREALRWLFSLVPLLLTAGSVPVIRQGLAAARSGFLPPPGAWIIAGQRTYAGDAARRRGRLQWIAGVVMLVAGWVGSLLAYLAIEQVLEPLLAS